MANPRPPLEKLGKYELVGRIGFGGMAEVYLARQKGPAGFVKLVAIKRLLPHLHADKGLVEMFLDEARIAARISHPNVVQIFDLGGPPRNMALCLGDNTLEVNQTANSLTDSNAFICLYIISLFEYVYI